MIPVLIIALAATLVVLSTMHKNNKSLKRSVADLGRQVEELTEPKPFGLTAVERLGAMFGGLTAEIVRIAYAAAAVCERPNTVAEDTVGALNVKAVAISMTKARISELEDEIREEQADLGAHEQRQAALEAIEALLPKK